MFRFDSPKKTDARKRKISAGKPKRKSLVAKKIDKEIDLSEEDDDGMISKPSKPHESRNDRSLFASYDDGFGFLELGAGVEQGGFTIPIKKNSAGKPRRKSLLKKKLDEEINLSQKDGNNMTSKSSKSHESRNVRSFVPSMDVANSRKRKKMNSFAQTAKETVLVQSSPARPRIKFTKVPSSDNDKKREKATKVQPIGGIIFNKNKKTIRNTYGSTNNSSRNTQTDGSVGKGSVLVRSPPARPLKFTLAPSSDNNKKRKKATKVQPLKGRSFEKNIKKNRNTYGSTNSLPNTQTEGSLSFRENSQLSSTPRPSQWMSTKSSSSRENSNKWSNQTPIFEEYSERWPTPQTSTASEQTASSIQVLSLAKIFLGKKLLTQNCHIDFTLLGLTPQLRLTFKDNMENHREVKIDFSKILEGLKYFISNDTDEDDIGTSIINNGSKGVEIPDSFLVFDVEYDKDDDLHEFRDFYEPFPQQEDDEDKSCIILEPQSVSRFSLLIEWLQINRSISTLKLGKSEAAVFVKKINQKQSSSDNQNQRLQNSQPALCQHRVLSMSQIVLGKKILTNKCCIELMIDVEPYLQLGYTEDLENHIQVKIYFSNITEGIKYFISNDEARTSIKSFMVFDAKYDKSDDLHKSHEFYDWSSDNIDKRYIILEPRSVKRFQNLIEWLQSKKPTNIQRLSTEDASKYIQKIRQRQSSMNRQVTRNIGDITQDHQQPVVKLEKNKQKPENSVQENKVVCSDAAASEVVTTTASSNSVPDVNTDEIIKLFVFEEDTHESFDLSAEICNTVGFIKHKIMEQKNIPIDQQCLLWKNDELLDFRKLYEYDIKKNSTLFLKRCISL